MIKYSESCQRARVLCGTSTHTLRPSVPDSGQMALRPILRTTAISDGVKCGIIRPCDALSDSSYLAVYHCGDATSLFLISMIYKPPPARRSLKSRTAYLTELSTNYPSRAHSLSCHFLIASIQFIRTPAHPPTLLHVYHRCGPFSTNERVYLELNAPQT